MYLYRPYNRNEGMKIEAICGMIFEEACGFFMLQIIHTTEGWHGFQGVVSQLGHTVLWDGFQGRSWGLFVGVCK
jgi:hypothetical protein